MQNTLKYIMCVVVAKYAQIVQPFFYMYYTFVWNITNYAEFPT